MAKPKRGRSTAAIDDHVGGRIRERRIMLGLTQQQLAEMIGVTYQQAHKYERGINRVSAGRLFDHAGDAASRVDPEISVTQPGAGEAAGATPARHRRGRDHEPEAPFLDHAREELRVVRVSGNDRLEPSYDEIANGILRHQTYRLGPQHLPAIGAALVQKNLLEGEIVRRSTVEPAAAHLKFRLLREFEGDRAEPAVLAPGVHADQAGATIRGQPEFCVLHAD